MDWTTVIQWGVGAILTIGAYMFREFKQQLKDLDDEVGTKVTESQVRQLIADKVDPIHEDLQEIKSQLVKLTDYVIKSK